MSGEKNTSDNVNKALVFAHIAGLAVACSVLFIGALNGSYDKSGGENVAPNPSGAYNDRIPENTSNGNYDSAAYGTFALQPGETILDKLMEMYPEISNEELYERSRRILEINHLDPRQVPAGSPIYYPLVWDKTSSDGNAEQSSGNIANLGGLIVRIL